MQSPLLDIQNLTVEIGNRTILQELSLCIRPGETHVIMGPNGSGKSTLAAVLAGKPEYTVNDGRILYRGADLLTMEAHERARQGLFLAFQYPVEIPGVSNMEFLKTAHDQVSAARGQEPLTAANFIKKARLVAKELDMPTELLKRGVNEGFSGGEKKRNEIIQMIMLEPDMVILDETDSGLDIDALSTVATGIKRLQSAARGFLVITHYPRLLKYLNINHVHVLSSGRIMHSGDHTLAQRLEQKGYNWIADGAT